MPHSNQVNNKKFFWLKLEEKFFNDARLRKMRSLPKGDACVIVYLKLLLFSLAQSGSLLFEGIEDSFAREMALKIGEKPVLTQATINFLTEQGMLVPAEKEDEFLLLPVSCMIGSETQNNIYKRERKKRLALEKIQAPSKPIPIEKEKEIEIEQEQELEQELESEEKERKKKIESSMQCDSAASQRDGEVDFSKMGDEELIAWGKQTRLDYSDAADMEVFAAYCAECDRRRDETSWQGKIVKGNGVFEKLKSHEEILAEHDIDGPLRSAFLNFLRACYLNGSVVPNDKLEDIIFRLSTRHGDGEDSVRGKIEELNAAVRGGYLDIRP